MDKEENVVALRRWCDRRAAQVLLCALRLRQEECSEWWISCVPACSYGTVVVTLQGGAGSARKKTFAMRSIGLMHDRVRLFEPPSDCLPADDLPKKVLDTFDYDKDATMYCLSSDYPNIYARCAPFDEWTFVVDVESAVADHQTELHYSCICPLFCANVCSTVCCGPDDGRHSLLLLSSSASELTMKTLAIVEKDAEAKNDYYELWCKLLTNVYSLIERKMDNNTLPVLITSADFEEMYNKTTQPPL